MVGRIAIALCLLTGVATACPPSRVETMTPSDDAQGVAVALAIMGASTLLFAITRRNAVRRTYATSRRRRESSLGLAQSLARLQRVPALLGVLASLGVLSQVSLAWSVAPSIVLVICVATLWRLQHLLGLDDASVTAHGHFLFIEKDGRLAGWIAAPPRQVTRAGVPVARTV